MYAGRGATPESASSRIAFRASRPFTSSHSLLHGIDTSSTAEASRVVEFVNYALQKFARLGLLMADPGSDGA